MAKSGKRRVGVLMGGMSAEREVSLRTGAGILKALLQKGHVAIGIEWTREGDFVGALRKEGVEVVWNALHGTWGEDGCVQGLLECLRIPYTGSGVTASALAMDKVLSKRMFDDQGIATPAWRVAKDLGDARVQAAAIGFPLVVKPSCEGSTVGVSIVKTMEALDGAVAKAAKLHGEVLLERYIAGRELSVGVLDGEVLGSVEIRLRGGFYDYESKYERDDNEYLVPAPIAPPYLEGIVEDARRAAEVLGCTGHARVDVRVDERNRGWVLEVNTLPGMTGTSLLPKIAAGRGMDYATLVEKILDGATLHS